MFDVWPSPCQTRLLLLLPHKVANEVLELGVEVVSILPFLLFTCARVVSLLRLCFLCRNVFKTVVHFARFH